MGRQTTPAHTPQAHTDDTSSRPQTTPDAVILLQMGGPATGRDVRPFLEALFQDRDIIRLPRPMRPFQSLFAKTVSVMRAPLVRRRYRSMGGGSPLNAITKRQAKGLEDSLGVPVQVANRYTPPRAKQVCRSLADAGANHVLVLPLYPHWSHTTTGSSLRDLQSAANRLAVDIRFEVIRAWGDDPDYVRAMADTCLAALERISHKTPDPAHLILSAHSLPERYIKEGDPYQREVEESARLVNELLKDKFASVRLGFQSAVGPMKWIGPETDEHLEDLADDGAKAVVLAPFGFVSDHIETRFDLDRKYRDQTQKLGIAHYERASSFNDDPAFIRVLKNLVQDANRIDLQEVVPSHVP